MNPPLVSIIIPTYQRIHQMTQLLIDLNRQTIPLDRLQVLVVDDGSPTDPLPALRKMSVDYDLELLRLAPGGPARARNKALERATGEYVLFLNDDVRAAPDLVEAHLASHLSMAEPTAVLGDFRFPEALREDLFCRVLEDEHLVISTRELKAGRRYAYRTFWTGNMSIPRAAISFVGGFDEGFHEPSHEDLDLGIRLERSLSMNVFFNPLARCEHDHLQTPGRWREQSRMGGRNAFRLHHKHGGLQDLSPLEDHGQLSRSRVDGVIQALNAQESAMLELQSVVEHLLTQPDRLAMKGRVEFDPKRIFELPRDTDALVGAAAKLLSSHDQQIGFLEEASRVLWGASAAA